MMIRLAGIAFVVVASRLVHGSASRSPSIGGSAGVVPPARMTARRASIVSSPTTTRLLAVEPAPAAEERDAALLEPRQLRAVVEVVDDLVAAREHAPGRRARPCAASAAPGMRRASASTSAGRRSALRRHARPVGALAADLAVLDDRDLEPALGEPPRRHLAARARARAPPRRSSAWRGQATRARTGRTWRPRYPGLRSGFTSGSRAGPTLSSCASPSQTTRWSSRPAFPVPADPIGRRSRSITDDQRRDGGRASYVRRYGRILAAVRGSRPVVIHSRGTVGTLRRAITLVAALHGRPAHSRP